MKVKDLLEIQGIIDNRIIPNDMNDNKLNEHYSESKGEFMSILDIIPPRRISRRRCLWLYKWYREKSFRIKKAVMIDN